VALAIVLDALGADGPADQQRIDPGTCLQASAPGTDPVAVAAGTTSLYADAAAALAAGPMTDAEPPLRACAGGPTETHGPATAQPPAEAPTPSDAPTLPATGGSGVPLVALAAVAVAVLLLGACAADGRTAPCNGAAASFEGRCNGAAASFEGRCNGAAASFEGRCNGAAASFEGRCNGAAASSEGGHSLPA